LRLAGESSSTNRISLWLADENSPSDRMISKAKDVPIQKAVVSPPPKDREVLVIRYLEQFSTAKIAALGISEGAVKARLVRALVRLPAE
jgi:DNA-directed RNA polymerase specialized sigma24 family protein